MNLYSSFFRFLCGVVGEGAALYSSGRGLLDKSWGSFLHERKADFLSRLSVSKNTTSHIWIHAASVGEVRGILPLVRQIEKEYPDFPLLLTTTSVTGRATAAELFPDATVCLAPLDNSRYIVRFLDYFKPKVCIINETEIWPNMLIECSRTNVPVYIVNGRISDSSWPRYRTFGFLFRPLLKLISKIYAQSTVDRDRFIYLGSSPKSVEVLGSTKYDSGSNSGESERKDNLQKFRNSISSLFLFSFGSVREEEEEIVLDSVKRLLEEIPDVFVVIAPRHPRRFQPYTERFKLENIDYTLWSSAIGGELALGKGVRVMFLDTLGDLGYLYSLSDASFVGGTLAPLGGHNILEPAEFSVPVIVGPYTVNVRPAEEALRNADAFLLARTSEEMVSEIKRLYLDPLHREKIEKGVRIAWENSIGTTSKLMERFRPVFN
ncbi:MAG TPA: glycosyltransferase N-terminal domain-containing protein [Oligoflexia bacterium]|nr:glycosyltransferase N-terminal domain-containing protein [Oligoflexia bacterium]HMP49384.1 glycosyltransferase N-terminal domain-containing protein [Oligoflexia bacterium]